VPIVAQPLIAVTDVEASSDWYCRLLGCTSGHGGPAYERVVSGDDFVWQLRNPDGYVVVLAGRSA
jgi:hypothetical protein